MKIDQESTLESYFGRAMALVDASPAKTSQILVPGYRPNAYWHAIVTDTNQAFSNVGNKDGSSFPDRKPPVGYFFAPILIAKTGLVMVRVLKDSLPTDLQRRTASRWFLTAYRPPIDKNHPDDVGILTCLSEADAKVKPVPGIVGWVHEWDLSDDLDPSQSWCYLRAHVDITLSSADQSSFRNWYIPTGPKLELEKPAVVRSELPELYTRILQPPTSPEILITVISGHLGSGKTTLARDLFFKADASAFFHRSTFLDARKLTKDEIHRKVLWDCARVGNVDLLELPKTNFTTSQTKIFLVIVNCEDWSIIEELRSLPLGSQIVVTTQFTSLAPQNNSKHFHLSSMRPEDACGMLGLEVLPQNLNLAQGHPLSLLLLQGMGLQIEQILAPLPISLNRRIQTIVQYAIEAIGSQEEIWFFCALAHFRHWPVLPEAFVLSFWGWIAEVAEFPEWNSDRSLQLLKTLRQRRLISFTEAENPDSLPRCRQIYGNDLKLVSIHPCVWTYCSSRLPKIWPGIDLVKLVSLHLGNTARVGRYDFLTACLSPSIEPVSKFLASIHLQDACSDPDYESGCEIDYESLDALSAPSTSEPPPVPAAPIIPYAHSDIHRYLSSHSRDIESILDWSLKSLDTHLLETATCFDCICVEWAISVLHFIVLHINEAYLDRIQPMIERIIQLPSFYEHKIVRDVFQLCGQSQVLSETILKDLTARPDVFVAFKAGRYGLYLDILKK